MTWNYKAPHTDANKSSVSVNAGNDWYSMGVKTIVTGWKASTFSNYGFMVMDSRESGTTNWTTIYSSDAPSPNKPELVVTYTETVPTPTKTPSPSPTKTATPKPTASKTAAPTPTVLPYGYAFQEQNSTWNETDKLGYWTSSPTVAVVVHSNHRSGFDDASIRSHTKNAINAWKSSSNGMVEGTYTAGNNGKIRVIACSFGLAADYEEVGEIEGITSYTVSLTNTTLIPLPSYRTFYYSGRQKKVYKYNDLAKTIHIYLFTDTFTDVPNVCPPKVTIKHELGHAYGWWGHQKTKYTGYTDHLMWQGDKDENTVPSNSDVNHIKQLWN